MAYKIYPSLLDSFSRYLQAEGCLKDKCRKDLLDAVNRVPFSSEAVDMGTAFNAIIDCYISGRPHTPTERAPYTLDGNRADNIITASFPATAIAPARLFYFNRAWCYDMSRYFEGASSQAYVSATLPTRHGDVTLYGVIDEIIGDTVFDIKTTQRYYPGKYAGGWQRHVYPYCLTESGHTPPIKAFEYTCFELKAPKGRIITGTPHCERHPYDHAASTSLLTAHVERFIEFLTENKHLITNTKIFGE